MYFKIDSFLNINWDFVSVTFSQKLAGSQKVTTVYDTILQKILSY